MTEPTPPPPHEGASAAEVTFAHRLATAETLRSTGNHVAVVNWIQTGVANEFLDENLSAVAQALADAEASGRASRDAELERVRQPINSAEAYDLDAIHAFDRITAALAARGAK